MSTMQAEVFEAFRDMGASEDKALRAAAALGKSGDEIAALRADINYRLDKVGLDIACVKAEQVVIRWMLGFVLATNVALLFRLFSH